MRVIGVFIILLLLLFPVWGKEKKKIYVAKSEKSVTYKKKKRSIRYPVRVNTSVSGEKLKLEEMLKDIYE